MKYCFFSFCLLCFCGTFSQNLVYKKNIVYAKAPDWHNKLLDLKLDLIYPYSVKKMPLFVYVHGGGFVQGFKEDHTPFCERLAQKGFIVANVEYRQGFDQSAEKFQAEITKAVYRAQQDETAALHYLVRHSAEYPIDTSAIFIGGESAGGVTSLFAAFVTQDEWNNIAPLKNELGVIRHSGTDQKEHFSIKGVINLWGGIADTSLISPAEMQATPILLFHSEDDQVVPFEFATHRQTEYRMVQGSRDIANRYKNSHACYQLHFIKGARHAYGFSADYLSTVINEFIYNTRKGSCTSAEKEINPGNPSVHFLETGSAIGSKRENKAILLSPDVLQQYVGQYEGNGVVITITVEGDHLKVQPPNEAAVLLYPKAENLFFAKEFDADAEFVRDSEGKITEHVVYLKSKTIHYKKTK
jgi:poly(3-hydroxybutyrate) depolymerase